MIVDLPSTSTTQISRRLVQLRSSVGAMAMGRVLTLLVPTDDNGVDEAVVAANNATRQHPARILIVVHSDARGQNRLDAQIRVGGDAGASEVVVLRLTGELTAHADSVVRPLLLPDSPIVAWWPSAPPADVSSSPLGQIAHRRITDSMAAGQPAAELLNRAEHYASGDSDLAWTRITRWRAVLASALDQLPFEPVTEATVTGAVDSPSADLMAGWLGDALDIPVRRARSAAGTGLRSVRLLRESGPVDLIATTDPRISTLAQPGHPVRAVPVAAPGLQECLADELRRLEADQVYAAALVEGRKRIMPAISRAEAIEAGYAPQDTDALKDRLADNSGRLGAAQLSTKIFADADALAGAVAEELDRVVQDSVARHGVAHIALTGGSMGAATVAALAARDLDAAVWNLVHIWWGDERLVPLGHADRNDHQARDAGLTALPVLAGNVHSVPGTSSTDVRPTERDAAAAAYADELAQFAADPGAPAAVPDFAVVMLGVGPDAHVASLFPGREHVTVVDRSTVPVSESPKPPADRVSLTVPAINSARQVWLVVAGADKAPAVAMAARAKDDPLVPASWAHGADQTVWWMDKAAAADLD